MPADTTIIENPEYTNAPYEMLFRTGDGKFHGQQWAHRFNKPWPHEMTRDKLDAWVFENSIPRYIKLRPDFMSDQQFETVLGTIRNAIEPVIQQNNCNAALFYSGKISQSEYEQRCINAGFEPIEIVGFYKHGT